MEVAMKKIKSINKFVLTITLTTAVVLAASPVQAAIKVSNSYSSSAATGSIVSLKSYNPSQINSTPTNTTNTQTTSPSNTVTQNTNNTSTANTTANTTTNTNNIKINSGTSINTANNNGSVVSLKNYKVNTSANTGTTTTANTANTNTTPTTTAPQNNSSTSTPQATTSVTAPATTGTATLNAQEQAMIAEINKERAANGLAPLTVDTRLVELAQLKAMDMKTNGYFNHTSPTYGTPFEMLKNAGIKYRYAGENIARNMSVDAAMAAFMSSDGHRKNILNSAYTHVGVGVVNSGSTYYFVQIFVQY